MVIVLLLFLLLLLLLLLLVDVVITWRYSCTACLKRRSLAALRQDTVEACCFPLLFLLLFTTKPLWNLPALAVASAGRLKQASSDSVKTATTSPSPHLENAKGVQTSCEGLRHKWWPEPLKELHVSGASNHRCFHLCYSNYEVVTAILETLWLVTYYGSSATAWDGQHVFRGAHGKNRDSRS